MTELTERERLQKNVVDAKAAASNAAFHVYDEAYSTKKEAVRLLRNYLKEQDNEYKFRNIWINH